MITCNRNNRKFLHWSILNKRTYSLSQYHTKRRFSISDQQSASHIRSSFVLFCTQNVQNLGNQSLLLISIRIFETIGLTCTITLIGLSFNSTIWWITPFVTDIISNNQLIKFMSSHVNTFFFDLTFLDSHWIEEKKIRNLEGLKRLRFWTEHENISWSQWKHNF